MATQQPLPVALSIKQPWAALVVAGLKTIEIRRWSTTRRGRVLIHAARVPDQRIEGWSLVAGELKPLAEMKGGIIGSADLVECRHYCDSERFSAEKNAHCNDPSWFEDAGLYGFVFTKPQVLPFQQYPGWFRFFTIKTADQR